MMVVYAPSWEGERWALTHEQLTHLKARRLREGDPVRLVNGLGFWQEGVFMRASGQVRLGLSGQDAPPAARRCLALAWSRPHAMDWVVEKSVELGTTDLFFLLSDCVGNEPSRAHMESRMLRFRQLMCAALSQCGATYLPLLHPPVRLDTWIDQDHGPIEWALLDAKGLPPTPRTGHRGVVVGPEGGWSEREYRGLKALTQHCWSFSEHILRVETAAIVGMAYMGMEG